MAKKNMGARHFLYPQPAAIVGANVDGKPNYMTVAWCGIMQATPPLIYVSIRKERYTLPGIRENGAFSVNVPSADMVAETDYVGIRSGHKVDKSKVFRTFYGELEKAPMIEECPINMECRLVKEIDFEGTHIVFVGEIVQSYVEEGLLSGSYPDVKKVDPIIYSTDGKYWRLGETIGEAFSIGKGYRPAR